MIKKTELAEFLNLERYNDGILRILIDRYGLPPETTDEELLAFEIKHYGLPEGSTRADVLATALEMSFRERFQVPDHANLGMVSTREVVIAVLRDYDAQADTKEMS